MSNKCQALGPSWKCEVKGFETIWAVDVCLLLV